jgi:hypothetical protein
VFTFNHSKMKESKEIKTILVTVFHSLVSKNIINTDAVRTLSNSEAYRIVLLVPTHKLEFFIKEYAHEKFLFEPVNMNAPVERWIEKTMHTVSMLLMDTNFLRYKRHEIVDRDSSIVGYLKHSLRLAFVYLFADRLLFGRFFRYIDRALMPRDVFNEILNKYEPDLTFTTDIFEQLGGQLIHEAQLRNIRTVGMVRSWDNCHSKGLLRAFPDVFIVNNDVIKDELIRIHGVPADMITPVGLPQFDNFIRKVPMNRREFFLAHGLNPTKRLVMFAPGGSSLTDTDADIAEILLRARENGELPSDIQFFVRNHPQHPADFSALKGAHDFFVQTPGVILDPTTHKENELTPSDQDFLRNILAHTDVLIWLATSLCLDGLVYDIPQIVVNFDGFQHGRTYFKSVKRYHDEGQMIKLFELNPFRVANSSSELIECTNMYLSDKTIDSEQRESARKQQLYSSDSESGMRVAEILKAQLS